MMVEDSLHRLSAIALVFGFIVACQLQVDGAALDSIKNAAKTVAESAAKKADETPDAPQTGGVRSTIVHTGINMATDKAIESIVKRHPGMKTFASLAKPLVNKAHSKINDYFSKKDEDVEMKEDAKEQKEGDAEQEKKGGLLSKIKSAVGVKDKDEDKEAPKEEPKEKPEEQVESRSSEEPEEKEEKGEKEKKEKKEEKEEKGEKEEKEEKEGKEKKEEKEESIEEGDRKKKEGKKDKKGEQQPSGEKKN